MNNHKFTKLLALIFFVFVVIIIGLVVSGKLEFTGNPDVILGFGVALASWIFTYGLADWLDRGEKEVISKDFYDIKKLVESHIETEFPPHKNDTTIILDVLRSRHLSLVNKKRKELDNKYYETIFMNAQKVKISGYANKGLFNAICKNEAHPLVNALKEGAGVVIEILISHPQSEYIEIRDIKEGIITGRKKPCSTDIMNSIKLIEKEFVDKYENIKLPNNNRMNVRLTKQPLNATLTYVCERNKGKEKMLLGFLFHHKLGNELPMYEIPRQNNDNGNDSGLFENCLGNFDELFRDARDYTLIKWDKDGCKYYPQINIDTH